MINLRTTPTNITTLKPNEIFVFGSNTAGVHGSGAALTARRLFGAALGVGEGLTGQAYAIPTLIYKEHPEGRNRLSKPTGTEIPDAIIRFLKYAATQPDLTFFMTLIGTGLAGFTIEEIGNIFLENRDIIPQNVIFPKEFLRIIVGPDNAKKIDMGYIT